MKRRASTAFLILCGVILALAACGKKGPPFLPKAKMPLSVRDLKGHWEKGELILEGSIALPSGEEEFLKEISGSRVYYARYPLGEAPCEGCPVQYQGYRETGEASVRGDAYRVRVPIAQEEGVHFFEVRLTGRTGALGPPSTRITLVVEP